MGLAVALAAAVAGCTIFGFDVLDPRPSPHPHQALLDELEANRATWEASGITRYAFTYTPACFCPRSPHLVVGDGPVVRIDGVAVDPGELDGFTPVGVPGLFDIVRRAIDGDEVTITYDPVTGVPTAMDSDPIEMAIDDELAFTVTDWTLDPPDDRLLGRITLASRAWNEHHPDAYTMTLEIDCDCVMDGHTYTARLRDGDVSVRSGGRLLDPGGLEGVPSSVDALFETAVSWAATGRATVEFDDKLGYPRRIAISPDPDVEGQRESITVTSFTTP